MILSCIEYLHVSSTQSVEAATSDPVKRTDFLTCFRNKLVQNKSSLLSLQPLGPGGQGHLGPMEGPYKISNSPKVKPEDFDFCDIVGNNLRCTNQVDEVREEQLDRGRCQALLGSG